MLARRDDPGNDSQVLDLQEIARKAGDLPAFPGTGMTALQLTAPALHRTAAEVQTMIPTLPTRVRPQGPQPAVGRSL